ncbi:alanine racemase [Candidatus Dependentiae bacterium]|nr:alanine racemase [Candidatus Dependentiae bacterium]
MKYRSWAEIDIKRLTENIHSIQKFLNSKTKYLQVVKADAYGHGAIEVSRIALNNNISYLGVANADEGIQLRLGEISSPIIILSPSTFDEIDDIIKYQLTPAVSSVKFAGKMNRKLEKLNNTLNIHIEIDTGMGRTGFEIDNAEKEIFKIAKFKNISIEGIFSHFPNSEISNDDFSGNQIKKFIKLIKNLKKNGVKIPLIHMANSGGIINYPSSHFNMVRAGILSYGEYPGPELKNKIKVKPVMTFKTQVILIKRFKKNQTVSYNRTFKVKKNTNIAILPIGYGDGYDFLLSNNGEVLINGKRFPIVGRVTMDLTMVDLGEDNSVKVGDKVTLIGQSGKQKITAEDIAKKAGTLNYYVLCSVGKRAPRIYINQKKIQKFRPILKRKDITNNLITKDKLDEIIKHSLQLRLNEEVGNSLFHGLFQSIFSVNDEPMSFRNKFYYKIAFSDNKKLKNFYNARIIIKYEKVFTNSKFKIACTNTERKLEQLFRDPTVEYRWLLEKKRIFDFEDFKLKQVKINNHKLKLVEKIKTKRGLEFNMEIPEKMNLLNQPVEFYLEFDTIHPKDKKEFPVYIIHPTKGLEILFDYSKIKIKTPKIFPFFAGKIRYPVIKYKKDKIHISTNEKDWIFPNSGLLIYWT